MREVPAEMLLLPEAECAVADRAYRAKGETGNESNHEFRRRV